MQARGLGLQRGHLLLFLRHERLGLIDLGKLDALARTPLEQLGVEVVTLAPQPHDIRIAHTNLLLQLIAVCVGLRGRLMLEFEAEFAHLGILALRRRGRFTQSRGFLLQEYHLRLHRMVRGMRLHTIRGQRLQLLLQRGRALARLQKLLPHVREGALACMCELPQRGQLVLRVRQLLGRRRGA